MPIVAVRPDRASALDDHPAKIADYLLEYRGLNSDGGICRIRIYQPEHRTPIVIASELPENENTSITNMADILAAETAMHHYPARLGQPDPILWIEHYPRESRDGECEDDYAIVSFRDHVVRSTWQGGIQRLRFACPSWRHVSEQEVRWLLDGAA